jgi:hypothetical protein
MKLAKPAFNKDALLRFFVEHGEKLGVGLVGLVSLALAWGGISSLRAMRPSEEQQPEAIIKEAADASAHIEAVKIAPDDELTSEKGLAATVAQWLAPEVKPAPPRALFDKPLFAELARRSSPTIFPVEELRAVAGVAVVAAKPKAAADRPAAERTLNLDGPAPAPQKGGKPPRGGRGPAPPQPAPFQPSPEMMGFPQPGMEAPQVQGKIVPYVLVSGLIPVAKQQAEYNRRFGMASLRDPNLDAPHWNGFVIEKMEEIPGTEGRWKPVDMKSVVRRYSVEWAGLHPEPFLPQLTLAPDQEQRDRALTPLPFCSPLPQLADGEWGLKSLHPWFSDYLKRQAEEQKAAAEKLQREAEENTNVFAGGGPSSPFDGGFQPPGFNAGPDATGMMPPGGPDMAGMADPMKLGPEYRLFRFIDTDVKTGRKYRYRVRASCWNPNLNVPSRHLVDTADAKKQAIESDYSEATPPVYVPDGSKLLVQPLKKQELKRLKPGTVAVMILGEKPQAGALALRALLMEVGGIANVDPATNKKGDPRSRGDAITTDRVLLDYRGRLDDRAESRGNKASPPPEPLEMLFLRPDGGFDLVSAAESQHDLERYAPTLPAEGGAPTQAGPGQPQPGAEGAAFGNPFAPQK